MKKSWPTWLLILSFIVSTILGGNNAIAVRFSNAELPPFFGGAIRLSVASVILFIVVAIIGLELPKGRSLVGALIFGVLQYGISYALIYWSLLEVPAGMFQVILALVPLLTFLFAILHRQEEFQWQILVGGLLALGGIIVIFNEGLSANVPLLSLFAIVIVAACFAESMIIFKAFPKSHPITTNAIAMGVGGLILSVISMLSSEVPRLPSLSRTWFSVIYLIIFGSIVIFVLSFYVLKHWKASITSYQLVLVPIVTIIFASFLAGEEISGVFIIGGSLVLLGVIIGALAPEAFFNKVFSLFRKNQD